MSAYAGFASRCLKDADGNTLPTISLAPVDMRVHVLHAARSVWQANGPLGYRIVDITNSGREP